MGTTVSQPTAEPVSLTEAKAHLRVTSSDDDTYITGLIKSARQLAEDFTGRSITTRTVVLTLDSFPDEIVLPEPPVQSVTSIQYVDENGSTQTLSSSLYQTNLSNKARPTIKPAYEQSWPTIRQVYNAVTVTYVAGFGSSGDSPDTSADIPSAFKHAILLIIGTLYEFREEIVAGTIVTSIPNPAKSLLWPYRVNLIA